MAELQPDYFDRPLAEVDPEVAEAVERELERQRRTLEMIASENFVPQAVLECQGSVLTNKYAEGYPGKRYYGGCEYVDVIEQLAIDRAKALFGAEHANVQPHAGAQANAAVYHALLQPGDTIMGLALPHGGHLTHGMKINVSGRLYDIAPYEVSPEDHRIDMDEVARIARERRPKLILAGWSAYSALPRLRALPRDRRRGRRAADGRHGALRRARGGGPASEPGAVRRRRHDDGAQDDRRRARRADPVPRGVREEDRLGGVPRPAGRPARARHRRQGRRLADRGVGGVPRAPGAHGGGRQGGRRGAARRRERAGVAVLTGGTDVHLVLVDLRESELDGRMAEDRLHDIGITVNRNAVPFDPRPPAVSSGLRVGTPALATRGLQVEDFHEIGRILGAALQPGFDDVRAELAERVTAIADRYPLYAGLRGGDGCGREPASPKPAAGGQPPRPCRASTPRSTRPRGSAETSGSSAAATSAAAGRSAGCGRQAAPTMSASAGGVRRGSGSGARTSCGKRTAGSAARRASDGRGKGGAPATRVVERRAEAPHVGGRPGARAVAVRRALLGRHVGVGAGRAGEAPGAVERARDAEVDEPRRGAHDDVLGLDVEVDPALGRHVVQRARRGAGRAAAAARATAAPAASSSSRSVGPSRCSISRCG